MLAFNITYFTAKHWSITTAATFTRNHNYVICAAIYSHKFQFNKLIGKSDMTKNLSDAAFGNIIRYKNSPQKPSVAACWCQRV